MVEKTVSSSSYKLQAIYYKLAKNMPLTKEKKQAVVQEVEAAIKDASGVVFMSFDGLTIAEVNELRTLLFAEGVAMRVMPKRLLRIVLKQRDLNFDPLTVEGQMAVVWGKDPMAPSKVVYGFAKTHPHITLSAGVLEGNVLNGEEVLALAKLPSREQLLTQLVGVLAGPARGLVSVLSGVQRQTVYVLTAIKDKKATSV